MPYLALTVLLALLTMVGPLGIDAYLPSFPAIGDEFGVSALVVQQTLSVYVAAMSVMMLFYGTLSDSFGRRPVMMVALVLFCLTSLAAALAPSIEVLIVVRALQGLCAGAGTVIARAMVQDRFRGNEAQRMMAMITMVFGAAPAIAPLIGGWLQVWLGWRSVFVFLVLFGAALWETSRRVLDETLPVAQRTPFRLGIIARNYGKALRSPRFMLRAAAIALIFGGIGIYVGSASAFVMGILGRDETDFGWLFVPLVAGMVVGSALAGKLSRRYRAEQMIRAGTVVMLAAVAASVVYTKLFTPALPYVVLPIMGYTFGLSLASPGLVVTTLSQFPEMRGLAASMQAFVQMMGFALITGVLAPHLFGGADLLALGHAALLSAGLALWYLAGRVERGPAGA